MNAQLDENVLEEALAEGLAGIASDALPVSDKDFLKAATEALESVGGRLLFSMRTGDEDAGEHVAAGCLGDGDARQILLLSQPVSGGQLKVEPASKSGNPLSGIAASYAALMDALNAAA
ncbi:hypothetical protein [Aquamicrobium ahrensii]|uniref:Uncharacterized protein n=1 Tax=Aquamicrobium ahrensii TaxID=469551 RepID=A0ABV2KIK4_9HYPH